MDDRKYKVKVYLYEKPEVDIPVEFVANDTNSCSVELEFYSSRGKAFDITGKTISVIAESGSTKINASASIQGANKALWELSTSELLVGSNKATVQVYGGNERLTFGTFKYKVSADPEGGSVTSNNNYPILTSLISDVQGTINTVEQTNSNIAQQEQARESNEAEREEKFKQIEADYESYKGVMISESNVAALQNNIKQVESSLAENTQQIKDMAINVKNYGAIGDGIADDTNAIAMAIAMLDTNGTLYFPKGTYVVTNIACVSNINIQGSGWGTVIKLRNGTPFQGNCFSVNGVTNVTIKDLQIDGNRLNNVSAGASKDSSYNGIHIKDSDDITITNVWSHSNGYHGCIMVNANRINISHSKFNDNGFRPFHGHAHVYDSKFTNNICFDNSKGFAGEVETGNDGIFFFDDIKNVIIHDNVITSSNSRGCIVIGGTVTGLLGSSDISVIGNICTTNNTTIHGILLLGMNLNDCIIANNTIHHSRYGIYADVGYSSTGSRLMIINNNIHDCAKTGIQISSPLSNSKISGNKIYKNTSGGIYVSKLTYSEIKDNYLYDNGTIAPTYDAINLSNSSIGNVISGNYIYNSKKTDYQKNGINEVDSTNDYNIIQNNYFKNIPDTGMSVVTKGSNSVSNNNITQ